MPYTFSHLFCLAAAPFFIKPNRKRYSFVHGPWHTKTGSSSLDIENLETIKHPEDNKSADKINQKSLEAHLCSRSSQVLHFENPGNYINEEFCLTFFLVSSNFELHVYSYSLLIYSYSWLIYSWFASHILSVGLHACKSCRASHLQFCLWVYTRS